MAIVVTAEPMKQKVPKSTQTEAFVFAGSLTAKACVERSTTYWQSQGQKSVNAEIKDQKARLSHPAGHPIGLGRVVLGRQARLREAGGYDVV